MDNSEAILEMLKQNNEFLLSFKNDMNSFKDDVNRRFNEMDKRFEQIDNRFEQVDNRFEQVNEQLRDMKYDIRELKREQRDESKRINEIYMERKNIQIKWSLPFVGFNAGVAACVAFFVSFLK